MRTVYVAGNLLVEQDSLPVRLLPRLAIAFPGIDFRELDPSDEMPEGHLEIIDTVVDIDRVMVFTDIDRIETNKMYSLHDFDLGATLKLMKKAGRLKSVKIIGVPAHLSEDEAIKQISQALKDKIK